MNFTELTSDRLELLPLDLLDIDEFYAINTDAFVRKFLWDDELISLETAHDILRQNLTYMEEEGWGLWKIYAKGGREIMGYVGLWYFFEESQPQLLYAFLEEYTGMGYATEASFALLDHAFHSLDFRYLLAATDLDHTSSQAVLRRLGMKFVEKRMENGNPTLFYRLDKTDYLNFTYES